MVDALTRPLVHFLLLGALLFAAIGTDRTRAQANSSPAIDAGAGDEEVLLHAALERGIHERDPIVRRRLLRNARFLRPEDPRGDDAILEEAYSLGLHRGDLVVQRRLVQKMTFLAWERADAHPVPEQELRAAFERERGDFTHPARARISHVFLSRDRRGDRLDADATGLAIRVAGLAPETAVPMGDPFLLGAHPGLTSEADLTRRFGAGVATAAFSTPVGAWSAPVSSAWGMHLVFVHERAAARPARFDEARPRIAEIERARRRSRELARTLTELRGG
jgi:hypothetical protein